MVDLIAASYPLALIIMRSTARGKAITNGYGYDGQWERCSDKKSGTEAGAASGKHVGEAA